MRGALGTVYEFLPANPYQPGLSYFHIPLVFHDAGTGHVFARTSWDEDATWIRYFDGHLQIFRGWQTSGLARRPRPTKAGACRGGAVLLSAADPEKVTFVPSGTLKRCSFSTSLRARFYDVEIDDQELWEGVKPT